MRKYIVSILIVILVLASGLLIACGTSPRTGETWRSYRSSLYDYSIDYPSDWEVEEGKEGSVDISCPYDIAVVGVALHDSILPLSKSVDITIDSLKQWDDFILLRSNKPELKWDWVIAYKYSFEGEPFYGQAYWLEGIDWTYVVTWDASAESGLYELCQDITLTFAAWG